MVTKQKLEGRRRERYATSISGTDGLRGVAAVAVVIYHADWRSTCHFRFAHISQSTSSSCSMAS